MSQTPEELRARLASYEPEPAELSDQRSAYRFRAATFAWFDEEHLGQPAAEVLDFLAEDCQRLPGPDGRPHWMLNEPLRRRALHAMADDGQLPLPGHPPSTVTDPTLNHPLQRALDSALHGEPPPLEDDPELELPAAIQALKWVDAAIEGLPAIAELQGRKDLADLLSPLRELVRHGFEGRRKVLDDLRQYVGVLPPGSLRRRTGALLRRVFSLREQPPLMLWGPGGVGKSTVIAKFVLEHYEASERLSFAYLNVDRAVLDPTRPESLLTETIRQLALQHPRLARQATEARERIESETLYQQSRGATKSSGHLIETEYWQPQGPGAAGLAKLADEITSAGTWPLLLVLDTFEQVQRRGDAAVQQVWTQLDAIQRLLPMLRVVLAGRTKVQQFPVRDIELGDFDAEAARAYLLAQAPFLTSREVRRAARTVGGNPLNLRLAAGLLADPAADRSLAFLRMRGEQAQGMLYERILDHIHDSDVRKVAHPGLAVRRITPQVIAQVLAEPCDLGSVGPVRAHELCRKLEAEATLVERRAEDPTALYHRTDVRRLMLPGLTIARSTAVKAIHDAAIDYYAANPPEVPRVIARAEELYHRMMSAQPEELLASRWADAAARYLDGSLDELPAVSRVFLAARLNVEIDDETRGNAGNEAWQRYVAEEVRKLVRSGDLDAALTLVRERRGEAGESLLPALEVELLEELGQLQEAYQLALDQRVRARAGQDLGVFLAASVDAARLAERTGDQAQAATILREARQALPEVGEDLELLEVNAARLRLARTAAGQLSLAERDAVRHETIAVCRTVGLPAVATQPQLLRELSAELGEYWPELLVSAVRKVGVRLPVDGRKELAGALTSWEDDLSRQRGLRPGTVRSVARVPLAEPAGRAWQSWLDRRDSDISPLLARLLDEFGPPEPASRLATTLSAFFQQDVDQLLRPQRAKFS